MRFYDVPVNRSVPTEANRGLTSYTSWNPVEPHEILRNLMEFHGTAWNPVEPHGTSWNPTEPHGISQNLMESHGRFWNMAESSGC
jgi:hypothetical protein